MSIAVADAERMHALAGRVANACAAGDLVILDGDLGAGKTTFAQGFGAALDITEPITSPTFVIARVYRGPRVDLVHVDAYRVGSALELDDLDLDADLDRSITLVEWGAGKVEQLAADRLVVHIDRADDPEDDVRMVHFDAAGDRWDPAVVAALEQPW